jgi:hypothetical protein
MASAVRLRHHGTFNMGEGAARWRTFSADHQVVTCRPGFVWNARIALAPGVGLWVHDAYVGGEGVLEAAVLGLVTVASRRGGDTITEGELMRFLAEAVWYPSALLPSQGVRWEPVDARAARATLADGATSVALLFGFGADGLVESVSAAARGRLLGEEVVPTPWRGRFWSYQRIGGVLAPREGEVAWIGDRGEEAYWRGTVETLAAECAGPGGPPPG